MTLLNDKQVMMLLDADQRLVRIQIPGPLNNRFIDLQRRAGLMYQEEDGAPPSPNAITVQETQALCDSIRRALPKASDQMLFGGFIEDMEIKLPPRRGDEGRA